MSEKKMGAEVSTRDMLEREIVSHSNKLNISGRFRVLKLILSFKTKVSSHADGTRVNLDNLSEDQLFEVDALVQRLLKPPMRFVI